MGVPRGAGLEEWSERSSPAWLRLHGPELHEKAWPRDRHIVIIMSTQADVKHQMRISLDMG